MATATGTWSWFGQAHLSMAQGKVNYASDVIKLALFKSALTPNKDTHVNLADLGANEISATAGYSAGGLTLSGCTVSYDATTDQVRFFATDVSTSITTADGIAHLVVYDSTHADKPLLGYCTLSGANVCDGTFTVDFDGVNGYLYIDAT